LITFGLLQSLRPAYGLDFGETSKPKIADEAAAGSLLARIAENGGSFDTQEKEEPSLPENGPDAPEAFTTTDRDFGITRSHLPTPSAKKVWAYIKKHKLQDPKKHWEIVAAEKLKPVFGKGKLDMFLMTKAISKHLEKIDLPCLIHSRSGPPCQVVVVEKLIAVFRAKSGDNGVGWYCGKNQGRFCCILRMANNKSGRPSRRVQNTSHTPYRSSPHQDQRPLFDR
jgi:hypothetical protein